MGCTKCGTDLSSLHLIVKDIIRQLIDEGKLQEGLVDCTDKRLWRDSRVLTCDLLGDAVCQLITNGDICLVKPEALTVEKQENGSHKISLLMSDGTVLDTTARLTDGVLNSVTYDAKTKIAKFTTTNGDSYEIKLDMPEPVEYTFTKKDDGIYSVAKDGKELLAINPGVLDVKIEGDKLHVTNAAGEVKQFDIPMTTVTPTELTDNGDGTGFVKYGDTTLPVTTRPTTATKAEDGVVTITNSNGTTVEVPAIKVKAAKEADGKVVITNQDGSTVEIEKPAEAPSGLDCAAIDELPEKPWKKGTVLLAKQDGECVRLTAFDSIFQEIGVGITADKTNSFTNEEYKVVVTVSNTGEGKNELTNLNIVGPANTADYEIKDVTFTKSEADVVEQVDNLTYNIRGLKKGGTVKVKYTVVPKVLGNYQFTAAVNPNSALDKDLGNNNATLILNAQTKEDPNYIASKECPLITITDSESGEALQQVYTEVEQGKRRIEYQWGGYMQKKTVIYGTRGSKGLQLRVSEPSTLLVYGRTIADGVANETIYTHAERKVFAVIPPVQSGFSSDATYLEPNTVFINNQYMKPVDVTYANDVLTINEDVGYVIILAKPRGTACQMQAWVLAFSTTADSASIHVTDLVNATLTTSSSVIEVTSTYTSALHRDRDTYQVIPAIPSSDVIVNNPVESIVSTVKVKKGTAASATIDWSGIQPIKSNGLVTITDNKITVSADATPADSVHSQYLNVIIEE